VAACGVLALQGDWEAHSLVLRALGVEPRPVRTAADLDLVDSLIMPGGESSAMLRLMEAEALGPRIRERLGAGMPVLATCAGVILLAESVEPPQPSLGALAVDVVRNAYGRQVHSGVTEIALAPDLGEPLVTSAVFIRAPRIVRVGERVEVIGRRGADPVLVRQQRVLGATYHPELSSDRRVHELFLRLREDHHD
jgi:pyridoxal 5'-phosphate synthase pdxT subunit